MAIDQHKDVENGLNELENPFIQQAKHVDSDEDNGSIWMVLLSTCVAVCGSFEFGSCVSTMFFHYLCVDHIIHWFDGARF